MSRNRNKKSTSTLASSSDTESIFSSCSSANDFNELGKRLYSQEKWIESIDAYTKAISIDPNEPVFYCNRSASWAHLKQFEKSLLDAEQAISLKPT